MISLNIWIFHIFWIHLTHSYRNSLFTRRSWTQPALCAHKSSFDSKTLPLSHPINESRGFSYMDFMEYHLDFIRNSGMSEIPCDPQHLYRMNPTKTAQIGNMDFGNDKFRRVRCTYLDAGHSSQVCIIFYFVHSYSSDS